MDRLHFFFPSWYRVSDSNALYPVPSSQRIIPSNTLLYIRNADERCAGRWVSSFLLIPSVRKKQRIYIEERVKKKRRQRVVNKVSPRKSLGCSLNLLVLYILRTFVLDVFHYYPFSHPFCQRYCAKNTNDTYHTKEVFRPS